MIKVQSNCRWRHQPVFPVRSLASVGFTALMAALVWEAMNLAIDAAGQLVYLAPTRVNLQLAQERAPGVTFNATREHAHSVAVD